MRIKNIVPASMATICAMAALLATGAPAHAADTQVTDTTQFCNLPFERAGNGCFYSDGDKFTVQDMLVDGKRSVLAWRTSYGRTGECHDSNGANNAPTTCDYDLRENETLIFQLMTREGATGADSNLGMPNTAWTSGR
ncbi:hypothetical protein [Streptomyces sp. NPDC002990]